MKSGLFASRIAISPIAFVSAYLLAPLNHYYKTVHVLGAGAVRLQVFLLRYGRQLILSQAIHVAAIKTGAGAARESTNTTEKAFTK